jgi:hypothetical protein
MKSALFRHRSLGATVVALLGLFLVSGSLAQAQIADRPKASPEQQKLAMFAGEWSYEGTFKDTVLGPGGKFAGKDTVRFTLDGLFLESRGRDKGVYGGKEITYEGLTIRWYDAAAKVYRFQSFDNDGFVGSGTFTVAGSTWTNSGTSTSAKGQKVKNRGTSTFSADGKSQTSKSEISFDDGKTWSLLWELTAKKTKD